MILLGIDLETGGSFDQPMEANFITELGAVLYDTELKQPVSILNTLVKSLQPVSAESTQYTGITDGMLAKWGVEWAKVSSRLCVMLGQADAVVAHNGLGFDKPLLQNYLTLDDKPWIDTMLDVPYPANCRSTNLTYLAGFHGLLNCFPHRAVTDVLIMLEILAKYDIQPIYELACSPLIKIIAHVSFANNKLAKNQKFMWNPEKKEWYRNIRRLAVSELDTKSWGFKFSVEEL